jgi:hypothetical protein
MENISTLELIGMLWRLYVAVIILQFLGYASINLVVYKIYENRIIRYTALSLAVISYVCVVIIVYTTWL